MVVTCVETQPWPVRLHVFGTFACMQPVDRTCAWLAAATVVALVLSLDHTHWVVLQFTGIQLGLVAQLLGSVHCPAPQFGVGSAQALPHIPQFLLSFEKSVSQPLVALPS